MLIGLNKKSTFRLIVPLICVILFFINLFLLKLLGNYLGFPLLNLKPKHSDFDPIIHKLSLKLTN